MPTFKHCSECGELRVEHYGAVTENPCVNCAAIERQAIIEKGGGEISKIKSYQDDLQSLHNRRLKTERSIAEELRNIDDREDIILEALHEEILTILQSNPALVNEYATIPKVTTDFYMHKYFTCENSPTGNCIMEVSTSEWTGECCCIICGDPEERK